MYIYIYIYLPPVPDFNYVIILSTILVYRKQTTDTKQVVKRRELLIEIYYNVARVLAEKCEVFPTRLYFCC